MVKCSAQEEPIDPTLPIIDSHHHLFDRRGVDNGKSGLRRYLLDEYLDAIEGGHNVIASVFLNCYTMYRADGPASLREIGEVEFSNGQAAMSASGLYGSCRVGAAIVGSADLALGDAVRPVLEASIAAAPDRYRGIRISALWDSDPAVLGGANWFGPEYYYNEAFRKGFAHLAPLGLSFDAFVLAPQLKDVEDLARSFPDTQIILNHIGQPIGLGRHAQKQQEMYAAWRQDIARIAKFENVVVKIGGLGSFLSGSPLYRADPPASSEALAREWRPFAEVALDLFSADRCMFESNLPTDVSGPFNNICNAYKRIFAACTADEKSKIFSGTAKRIYRMNLQ